MSIFLHIGEFILSSDKINFDTRKIYCLDDTLPKNIFVFMEGKGLLAWKVKRTSS